MRRHVPTLSAAELRERLERVDLALASEFEALGPRPAFWRELGDALALGHPPDASESLVQALGALYRLGFANVARERESRQAWIDAIVTGFGARALAAAAGASPGTAGLAGIASHMAEALVLRAVAQSERDTATRFDAASVRATVEQFAAMASAELARRWKLPAALAAACRDVRRVPEQRTATVEARAVYLARLLGAQSVGAGFAAPGLDHEIRAMLALSASALAGVRRTVDDAAHSAVRLAQNLPGAVERSAAG